MPEHRHPRLIEARAVKVMAGTVVFESSYKSKGGSIHVTMETAGNKIGSILIAGNILYILQMNYKA